MRPLLAIALLTLLPVAGAQVASPFTVHPPPDTFELSVDVATPFNVTVAPACAGPADAAGPMTLEVSVTSDNPGIQFSGPQRVTFAAFSCLAPPPSQPLQFNATANLSVEALTRQKGKVSMVEVPPVPMLVPITNTVDASFQMRVRPDFGLGGTVSGTVTGELQLPPASIALVALAALALAARRNS